MIVPTLRRDADEAHHHGEPRGIGLLVDHGGVAADRSDQRLTAGRLREVSVRRGMRDDNLGRLDAA